LTSKYNPWTPGDEQLHHNKPTWATSWLELTFVFTATKYLASSKLPPMYNRIT